MSDYIEREAAIERLAKLMQLQPSTARAIIEAIPAADVRPVVFCKDCKHRGNTPDCPFCWLADKKMGDDHFCSFGEKREES